jgi:antirestriction protein ArdC
MQHPTATHVAGFRAWLKLGYAVKRGEKAIRIWVPIPPSRKQLEHWEQQGSDTAERPRTFFKLGPVFARDQVAPPATPATLDLPIHDLTGDDLAPTLPSLIALAGEIGSIVELEAMSGSRHGYYEPATLRIALRQDMAVNALVKTLIHDLAHALLRAEPALEDPTLHPAAEELIVESVAYTVCGALGLDSSSYSIPYLTSWSANTDIAIIEQTATVIDRVARRIEEATITPGEAAPPRQDRSADIPTHAVAA